MNNIERIFSESNSPEAFARGYIGYLAWLLDQLDTSAIAAVIAALEDARKRNSTIFIAGNGGSASTASHMANDIGMDVLKKSGNNTPFRVFALTDNVSLITAIANDDGYINMFVNQLRIHYRPGDMLVVISASGNSPNVVCAAEWVKKRGGKVLGFVGFSGGKLIDLCDVIVHVKTPAGEYGPVEDVHVVLDHLIANWLQHKIKGEKESSGENSE